MNKKNTVGIVVLGRYGDILNTLPIAWHLYNIGKFVLWAVHTEFYPVFDGVHYVTAVRRTGKITDVVEAKRHLITMCEQVLTLQLHGNPQVGKRQTASYACEAWRLSRLGLDRNGLPLVFTDRDRDRENNLRQAIVADKTPYVLYSASGHSSPFGPRDQLRDEIQRRCQKHNVSLIDISELRVDYIYDIIGLIENAAAVVCTDSMLMHLTHAAPRPLFGLVSEGPPSDRSSWYATPARDYWQCAVTYSRWLELLPVFEEWLNDNARTAFQAR